MNTSVFIFFKADISPLKSEMNCERYPLINVGVENSDLHLENKKNILNANTQEALQRLFCISFVPVRGGGGCLVLNLHVIAPPNLTVYQNKVASD